MFGATIFSSAGQIVRYVKLATRWIVEWACVDCWILDDGFGIVGCGDVRAWGCGDTGYFCNFQTMNGISRSRNISI